MGKLIRGLGLVFAGLLGLLATCLTWACALVVAAVVFGATFGLMLLITGALLMISWNGSVPALFALPHMDLVQGMWLSLLVATVSKSRKLV